MLTDDDTPPAAHESRIQSLIGTRVLQHPGDVNAGFVSENIGADNRLDGCCRPPGDLRHLGRQGRQGGQCGQL
ncbi:hypothetical protein [Mesorhizobium waimense]|uniref:hypothetical protein n=1 Tax=Mesorhizobium waimense TaxID=1300307 RepID=UPI001FE116FB|nr:hypothetical protein [Mesorhizobium waimense]